MKEMEISDKHLVLNAREGEVSAFGELVRRYQSTVYNVCFRLMGERNEAEDMSQEAFIRAHSRLGTFDVERPFGPWIRRVATNVCLNQLGRSGPVMVEFDPETEQTMQDPETHPERLLIDADRTRSIHGAILGLPPHYRAVIELRHYQELSYAEIGDTLQIPISDVKSHLYRARKALANLLREDDRST